MKHSQRRHYLQVRHNRRLPAYLLLQRQPDQVGVFIVTVSSLLIVVGLLLSF